MARLAAPRERGYPRHSEILLLLVALGEII
jgi:hypothetical protein